MFDLSEESIEALRGMLGKCLQAIHCLHLDWSLRNNQVIVFEDLVWSLKESYIRMEAKEIDSEQDYYLFTAKKQELPDPIPYEMDEVGRLTFLNPHSSIHIWSKIMRITLLSLVDLKPQDPPYHAILFHLENDRVIGVTPNFPWGFNLYFDSSAWKLAEGSIEKQQLSMKHFNTINAQQEVDDKGCR